MKHIIAIAVLSLAACGTGNPNTSWNTAGTGGMSPGGGILPPCTGIFCGSSGSTGTVGSSTTGTTGSTGTAR